MLSTILTPGTPVCIYIRYSSYKQSDGFSQAMQMAQANELIKKYELDLAKVYLDEKTSGYNTPMNKRKGLVKLLDDAEKGLFKVIITMSSDRLARNTFELLNIRELLDHFNIDLIYSMPGAIQPFAQDIVSELVSYANSMIESERIRDRVRAVLKNKVESGQWTGGTLPAGYRLNVQSGKIEIISGFDNIIKKIYNMYIAGYSFNKIAQTLDPSQSLTGRWTKSQIKGIIKNPFYCSYLTWNKRISYNNSSWNDQSKWIIVKSKHIPAIIDKATWDLAQAILQKKRSHTVSAKFYSTPYSLSGVAYCSCGKKLLTKDKRSYYIQKDGTKKMYGSKVYYCSDNCLPQIKKEILEDIIKNDIYQIISLTPTASLQAELKKMLVEEIKNYQAEEHQLNKSLRFVKKKKSELKKLIKDTKNNDYFTDEEKNDKILCYNDLIKHSQQDKEKFENLLQQNSVFLNQRKALIRNDYWNNILKSFKSSYNAISTEEKKLIIDVFYSQITVTDELVHLKYSLPGYKDAKIPWKQIKINWV